MAKSGYIEKSFGAAYSIRVDWTQESQSIANNTSTVKFVCSVVSTAANASFMGLAKTDTLTVNGKTYSMPHGVFSVNGISTTKLWETTVTVAHDADGSFSAKAISCKVVLEFSLSSSGYIESVTASGTMALDTIARASTMTYSGTTLGSNVTFVVKAASTAFRHKLTYKYGSKTGTIFSNKAAGTQTWAPSIDLASEFPNAKTGTVTYTLTTTNGSTTVGTKTYTSEWKIPTSAAPTVSGVWVTIDPYNVGTAASGISAFVQGYSKAEVTFHDDEVSYKYGASWKSYKIVCNGVTDSASPYRTGVLGGTSADIVCTVEDTRGYTASSTFSIVILPYSKPKITDISLYRSNEDGTPNSAGLCIYAKAKLTYSDLDGQNECQLLGYYRAQSGKYGEGIPLANNAGNTLTAAALTTQTYVAKIVATDRLGNSVSYEATIPTDSVAFHIKEYGNGAAFGKYCEEDNLLDIAWDVRFRGKSEGLPCNCTRVQTANTDLNNYKDEGWYFFTTTYTPLNIPGGANGYLQVVVGNENKEFVKQLFYRSGTPGSNDYMAWSRTYNTSVGWGPWYRFDVISEEGTSGIWTYKKYADGTAECWGQETFTADITTAFNDWYRATITPSNYPFAFTELPTAHLDATSTNNRMFILAKYGEPSVNNIGPFYVMRPTSSAGAGIRVYYHAIGKWK